MPKNKKYIYLACGGSGGHIIPGIKLAGILRKYFDYNIIFFGINRQENRIYFSKYLSKTKKSNYYLLPDIRLDKTNLYKNIIISKIQKFCCCILYMAKLFRVCFFVLKIFRRNPPIAVLGFGSYASFPVILTAIFSRKRKIVIHEQNIKIGDANKFLLPFVDYIILSFKKRNFLNKSFFYSFYYKLIESFRNRKYLDIKDKAVFLGNPAIIKESNNIMPKKYILKDKESINLLVLGGSQGSEFLNEKVPIVIKKIKKNTLKKITVTHIVGNKNKQRVTLIYNRYNVKNNVLDYCFDMESLYKKTDLIISRAGATTLSEICKFRIPSLLVPYKFAGSHQMENACYFKENKAAIIVTEDESIDSFLRKIQSLIADNKLRKQLVSGLNNITCNYTKEGFVDFFKKNLIL